MSGFHFVSQRSGVIATVIARKRSVQMPGGVGDRLDRVRAEIAQERVVDEPAERAETGEEYGGLDHPPYDLRLRHVQ